MAHVGQPLGGALVRDNLARFGGPRVPFVVVTLAGLLGVFSPVVRWEPLTWPGAWGTGALCARQLPWARGWRGRELGSSRATSGLSHARPGPGRHRQERLVILSSWLVCGWPSTADVPTGRRVGRRSAAQVWLSIAAHRPGPLSPARGCGS